MIRGLAERLGLDQPGALDDARSPKTQMALALGRVRHESQVYAGTVPQATVDRRRAANRRARASRRRNRGSR